MKSLRHLLLGAGRTLSFLAAVMLVLLPALPAHAHTHREGGITAEVHRDHGTSAQTSASVGAMTDHDEGGDPTQKAGDCCFVCHVSVIPNIASVPVQAIALRGLPWPGERTGPPDALFERLPEPPRPFT